MTSLTVFLSLFWLVGKHCPNYLELFPSQSPVSNSAKLEQFWPGLQWRQEGHWTKSCVKRRNSHKWPKIFWIMTKLDQTKSNQISFAQDSRYMLEAPTSTANRSNKKDIWECALFADSWSSCIVWSFMSSPRTVQVDFWSKAHSKSRPWGFQHWTKTSGFLKSWMIVLIRRMPKVRSEPWLCGRSPST